MGEVWVKDDRIIFVGTEKEALEYCETRKDAILIWDREMDCKGNLLMPGFKNAHTHSAMTFLRSLADDLPLDAWLHEAVFPREAKLSPEDIYHLSKLAILEYLTSGVTGVFEMYLTPDSIADAFEDCGMRCVQTGSLNDFSQSVEKLEEWYLKYNKEDSLNSFIPGFHAEYTCSKSLLEKVADLAHKYKTPVWCHNSETVFEVESCKERNGGLTPTLFLDSLGIFDHGGGGYHCVYLSDEDVAVFKKRGMGIVTNPASNAKLASGMADVTRYIEAGIEVAIGTDGPASNNCLDMFREMFLTEAFAKLANKDASALDARKVLHMATVGGARVMGLRDCDVLSPGKKADMIMIDLKQPNMQPVNNIAKNLVYAGSKQNVKMTMINGAIRYMDGEFFVGEDRDEIYRKAQEITDTLTRS
jgi:5-methylthioadenosine/S-adenosylhomocysteine deaminase